MRFRYCQLQFVVPGTHGAGFSLIELMVSVLLGSVLSLAISVVYIQSLRNFMAEDEMARIQVNGRYSLGILRRELMLTGFFAGAPVGVGMAPAVVSHDCVKPGNWALETTYPMDFVNNVDSSSPALLSISGTSLNCLKAKDIVHGTDIITVKRTAGNYTVRDGAYVNMSRARAGQWYVRSDNNNRTRSWFYNKSGGFPSGDVSVGSAIDYWEYYARIFYIRNYSETPGDGVPTLCVERLSGGSLLGKMSTQCLVEGVEDLQIEFGVDRDSDGTADIFVDTPILPDISNSTIARVFLLLRSVAELPGYGRKRSYSLGSKTVQRNDAYARHVLSITVQLPNLALAQR